MTLRSTFSKLSIVNKNGDKNMNKFIVNRYNNSKLESSIEYNSYDDAIDSIEDKYLNYGTTKCNAELIGPEGECEDI